MRIYTGNINRHGYINFSSDLLDILLWSLGQLSYLTKRLAFGFGMTLFKIIYFSYPRCKINFIQNTYAQRILSSFLFIHVLQNKKFHSVSSILSMNNKWQLSLQIPILQKQSRIINFLRKIKFKRNNDRRVFFSRKVLKTSYKTRQE